MQHCFLESTRVELVDPPPRVPPRHAVLDMDGTLSLLRDGWQNHMVPLMVDVLASCPHHESREEVQRLVIDFVDHLTGKQTIYQMIRLVEEVKKRGGEPLAAIEYKRAYYDSLNRSLESRLQELRTGRCGPERFLVPGAREFLEALVERGVRCHLASGTDIEFVRDEADLLDLTRYFQGGVFGALTKHEDFSKEKVIREILSAFDLDGAELLVVGDGYVEIQNARGVGATALGVFSKENNRYHMNADKRQRLVRAGAHFLAADLREGAAVLDYLEGRRS